MPGDTGGVCPSCSGLPAFPATHNRRYVHSDPLQYPVPGRRPRSGQRLPLGNVVFNAILAQAPYLRGTRLAEDPAAVLTYGVVAVGKEDFLNQVHIIPDGSGGMMTINSSLAAAKGADQALAVLQVNSSIEGMAMTAAETGSFGPYGESFVASYRNVEENLGR